MNKIFLACLFNNFQILNCKCKTLQKDQNQYYKTTNMSLKKAWTESTLTTDAVKF